jgi:hypothetical protein
MTLKPEGNIIMDLRNKYPSAAELGLLKDIQNIQITLQSVQTQCGHLDVAVADLAQRITALLAESKNIPNVADSLSQPLNGTYSGTPSGDKARTTNADSDVSSSSAGQTAGVDVLGHARTKNETSVGRNPGIGGQSRIILTTYPGQSGIHPVPMNWGHVEPSQRGPVVVSRNPSTIRRRNGKICGISHETCF